MAKNYSVELRNALKLQLIRSRGVLKHGVIGPICPICNHFGGNMDMHEVLITRGDLSGSPIQQAIMTAENCVLVHHEDCHHNAATTEGQAQCVRHLISYEGYDNIRNWLIRLDGMMKGNQAIYALKLLKEIHYGD